MQTLRACTTGTNAFKSRYTKQHTHRVQTPVGVKPSWFKTHSASNGNSTSYALSINNCHLHAGTGVKVPSSSVPKRSRKRGNWTPRSVLPPAQLNQWARGMLQQWVPAADSRTDTTSDRLEIAMWFTPSFRNLIHDAEFFCRSRKAVFTRVS